MGSIKEGDVVEMYRHYESAGNGGEFARGADDQFVGTKWKVVGIAAQPEYRDVGSGLREQVGEPYVELELVEGEYKELAPLEPPIPIPDNATSDDIDAVLKARWAALEKSIHAEPTVPMPKGHRMKLSDSPAYRRHFPSKQPNQQFFEEWRQVGTSGRNSMWGRR